jgi:hypothetical protein
MKMQPPDADMKIKVKTTLLAALPLLLAGGLARAEGIISSVDERGNVTFSDHVPANAVKSQQIRVDTLYPSAESQAATQERTQQMLDAAEQNRQQTESRRQARQQQAERRRSSIAAQQQREPRRVEAENGQEWNGYVDESGSDTYEPEYVEYIQQLQKADDEARAAAEEGMR